MTLEICCDSLASAQAAERGGADRIELCDNLAQGGITPSAGKILLAKRLLQIPVFVLIRPRKGDFLYSDLEFDLMLENIREARKLGADGIVSGVLLPDGRLDNERIARLVEAAGPLPFTHHRAFDMCREPEEALEQLAAQGVSRILTSGQRPTAVEGLPLIARLAAQAGDRIRIMACGNLLPQTIGPLLAVASLQEFHAAVRKPVASNMQFRGHVNMGDEAVEAEFSWQEVDETLVRGLREKLTAAAGRPFNRL